MATNSEQGKFLFSLFPFFFKTSRCDMKKKEAHLYEITSFTPYGHLLGVFFSFFSSFPLVVSLTMWSTSWFCWSLLVLWGLQVKPPFHQSGRSRTKATLRSWLNRTSAVFLLHAAFLSLTCKETLCFVSFFFCNCFSSGVSFSQHDECCSVVRLHFRDSKATSSFSFKWMLTTYILLVHFSAFAILKRS